MPTIYNYRDDVDVDVDEFMSACNKSDIKEIIEILTENGHIKDTQLEKEPRLSVNELMFEQKIDKLHGRYFDLTEEEEFIISKIASRF